MSVRKALEAVRYRYWLRACDRVGERPHLEGQPTIMTSTGQILIGDRFWLSSRPVQSHLVTGPSAVLEIGRDVSIAHGAAIAAFESVQIGDGTKIGPFVVIMDTNFHGIGDQSIQHDCRPVVIGSDCRIGSRVTITRGVTIGNGAEILAGSVVSSAIPPGACAAGGRARVIGRAGERSARWDSVAAVLPELGMEAFDLQVPADLELAPAKISGWNAERTKRFLVAIKNRFQVSLEAGLLNSASSLSEVAAVVERARMSPFMARKARR